MITCECILKYHLYLMTSSCYIWFGFYYFSILGTTETQLILFLPIIIEHFMMYNLLITPVHVSYIWPWKVFWYFYFMFGTLSLNLEWIIFSQIIKGRKLPSFSVLSFIHFQILGIFYFTLYEMHVCLYPVWLYDSSQDKRDLDIMA